MTESNEKESMFFLDGPLYYKEEPEIGQRVAAYMTRYGNLWGVVRQEDGTYKAKLAADKEVVLESISAWQPIPKTKYDEKTERLIFSLQSFPNYATRETNYAVFALMEKDCPKMLRFVKEFCDGIPLLSRKMLFGIEDNRNQHIILGPDFYSVITFYTMKNKYLLVAPYESDSPHFYMHLTRQPRRETAGIGESYVQTLDRSAGRLEDNGSWRNILARIVFEEMVELGEH